ncbi:hypothetical protein ABHI18_009898 [Aspergillus niger]
MTIPEVFQSPGINDGWASTTRDRRGPKHQGGPFSNKGVDRTPEINMRRYPI